MKKCGKIKAPRDHVLLEGVGRVIQEIQSTLRLRTYRYVSQEVAKEILYKVTHVIFDEIFRFGSFRLPVGYGSLWLEERRKRIFKDREYKRYTEANDETGEYYISFRIRYRPGVRVRERLKQVQKGAVGINLKPEDTDILEVLTFFETEDNEDES